MNKSDARTITDEALTQRRLLVIDLYQQQISIMQIVRESGLSWPAVKAAIRRFEKGGIEALEPKRRGKKLGTGRILTPDQELEICNILYCKRPWQVGLRWFPWDRPLHLWNRGAILQLIFNKYGITLSERGLAKYLKRWGFPTVKTLQPPIKRCSKKTQVWIKDHHDELNAQQERNVEIFFFFRRKILILNPVLQETLGVKHLTLASAVDSRNKEYWLVFRGNFTQKRQSQFHNALCQNTRKSLLLICSQMKYYNPDSNSESAIEPNTTPKRSSPQKNRRHDRFFNPAILYDDGFNDHCENEYYFAYDDEDY